MPQRFYSLRRLSGRPALRQSCRWLKGLNTCSWGWRRLTSWKGPAESLQAPAVDCFRQEMACARPQTHLDNALKASLVLEPEHRICRMYQISSGACRLARRQELHHWISCYNAFLPCCRTSNDSQVNGCRWHSLRCRRSLRKIADIESDNHAYVARTRCRGRGSQLRV